MAITVLLDSVNTSQPDLNANAETLLLSDYELNGTINRAASEGAKFALVLAMLEQDCTHRPHIEKPKDNNTISEAERAFNYYRSSPLSANDAYWQSCQYTCQLLHSGQWHSAHLWLAMHPEPLSLHNNPLEIEAEVIVNCNINAQKRMQQAKEKVVEIDETGLYDILQQVKPISG